MSLPFVLLVPLSFSFVRFDNPHIHKQKVHHHLANDLEFVNYSYFDQKVDHFNPNCKETFSQRYLVYDEYYDDSHTLLYYLNGESIMKQSTAQNGYYVSLSFFYRALFSNNHYK